MYKLLKSKRKRIPHFFLGKISVCLLTFFIFFVFNSISFSQAKKITLHQDLDTLFQTAGLKGLILNTNSFKKPPKMEERVILLINNSLYKVIRPEINRFIQDMFDEGIDVRAVRLDVEQLKEKDGSWKLKSGLLLKNLIQEAYQKFKMEEITTSEKRGLILLGSFPADFILWQQFSPQSVQPGWANIQLNNDFLTNTITIQWTPYKQAAVTGYEIRAFEIPNLSRRQDKVPLNLFNFKIPNFRRPGQRINLETNSFSVPPDSTQAVLHPPKTGQKNFQFEIKANLVGGGVSPVVLSPIVNWNFLINPSDYILADIDGFKKRSAVDFNYNNGGGSHFGIKTYPVLVVTEGVKSNNLSYELSQNDKQNNLRYAQAEMYFGRIDASSITTAWNLPDVDQNLEGTFKRLNDLSLKIQEISFIKDYLDRNHIWRKNKAYRRRFNKIYFYRSSDFVNPRNEKINLASGWKEKSDLSEIKVDDAKLEAGCTDQVKPMVCLYSKPDCSGLAININDDIPNAREFLTKINLFPQSLRLFIKGKAGGAQLFSEPFYQGKSEILTNLKNNLNDYPIGINFASIKLLSADDLNYFENAKPNKVSLYEDTNFNNPLTAATKNVENLNSLNAENQVSSLKIHPQNSDGAVVLYSDTGYRGDFFIADTDINDLDSTIIGNKNLSSLKFWNCFQLNSPSWDNKNHLINELQNKWKLVDLGVHGHPYGFMLSEGISADNRLRTEPDRRVNSNDIWNLQGNIKFLINHCCFNGQFMAPGNAGTTFLFRNNMLAEWCWSGSGTIEHETLHSRLREGARFGQAVMDNCEIQMSPQDSNPWRTYFTVVLGDPTLRIYYNLPDLNIEKIILPQFSVEKTNVPFSVSVKNIGEREIDQNMSSLLKWKVLNKAKEKVLTEGQESLSALSVEKEKTFNLNITEPLPAGNYLLQVEADSEDIIKEIDENNNKAEIPLIINKIKQTPKGKIKLILYAGGLFTKTDNPLFIEGEPNNDISHQEYPDWTSYNNVLSTSVKVGFGLEFQLSPNTAFEWGFNYSESVLRVEKESTLNYFDETRLKSINMPLLLKFKLENKRMGVYFGGGVEGTYFLSMKHHYYRKWENTVVDQFFGDDDDKFGHKLTELMPSRLNYSAVGLAGFFFKPLYIEGRYYFGLRDVVLDFSGTGYGETVNAGKIKGFMILGGFRF